MTFIKDLPEASKMTTWFANALEAFLPEWLESLVPYYLEAKNRDCDLFHLVNYKPMGAPCELYEKDGIGYYLSNRTLAFNSDHHYVKCGWEECFRVAHPDYDKTSSENSCNSSATYNIMFRYFNRKPPYDILTTRCSDYFKTVTNDPEVCFSLSNTSYICMSEKWKDYVDLCRPLE